MNSLIRFFKKFWILLRRDKFLSELDEEMAFHRAEAAQEFIASGMTPQAAREAAMRQFGNVTKLREQSHEAVTFRMETVAQDKPISMGFCLDCHRAPENALRPVDQVFNMTWEPDDGDQVKQGLALKEQNHINPPTDCSTCHR